ncbi:uridine kinase [Patescibacteria group bacterium]|nr:uridine kinase [Patescibacteria group bacterium]MBU1721837.1 uridine kinase [Patescibacteria group bacterium]MBU1901668.1 uridine kinase [Patescibacteria group bacterium]
MPKHKNIQPKIILVAGASGSGKSTVIEEIKHVLGDLCVVIPLDMFYLDFGAKTPEEQSQINFDHPKAIDWRLVFHVLLSLKAGNPTLIPIYDFETHSRKTTGTLVEAAPIILLEGLMALFDKEVRSLAHRAIFVDAELDICLQRRIARDTKPVNEGGRGRSQDSVLKQWLQVREMYRRFFEPTKQYANIVLPEGGHNKEGIHILLCWLRYELGFNGQTEE